MPSELLQLRINKELSEALDEYAQKHTKTRAEVVRQALQAFLGKSLNLPPDDEADQKITDLACRVEAIEATIENLRGIQPVNPIVNPRVYKPTTGVNPQGVNRGRQGVNPEVVEKGTQPVDMAKGLTAQQLAMRLGVDLSSLWRQANKSPEDFALWARSPKSGKSKGIADPDGFGWRKIEQKPGNPRSSLFFPVIDGS
jgi:hypothetical protein